MSVKEVLNITVASVVTHASSKIKVPKVAPPPESCGDIQCLTPSQLLCIGAGIIFIIIHFYNLIQRNFPESFPQLSRLYTKLPYIPYISPEPAPNIISAEETQDKNTSINLQTFFNDLTFTLCIFSAVFLYTFYCDFAPNFVFDRTKKFQDLTQFIILLIAITIAFFSCGLTPTPTPPNPSQPPKGLQPPILPRHQTDEWRGWMQVAFVLYHYFSVAEMYTIIRLLIASYIFLTGYGNLTYFLNTSDFSPIRFIKMLFRLNFMVTIMCLLLNNEYMLYYICPLHTWWFLVVFATMRIGYQYNKQNWFMIMKFAFLFLFCFLLWDLPLLHRYINTDPNETTTTTTTTTTIETAGAVKQLPDLFDIIFSPFTFILQWSQMSPPLYEWKFRSGLDHYIALYGMIFAYSYSKLEKWLIVDLEQNPSLSANTKTQIKVGIFTVAAGILSVWWYFIGSLNKFQYNQYHPYTSFIPVTCYIVMRNIFESTRWRSVKYMGWFGRISLEMYLLQFHIWLALDAKRILWFRPFNLLGFGPESQVGIYSNWVFNSAIYSYLSNLVFEGTTKLNDWLFPNKGVKLIDMGRRCALVFMIGSIGWILALFASFVIAGYSK
eukprot:TRINITY_DN11719_c0_g1_i1.p1 TRINITY_DN11719_c0_g1~~TRINITY_DN11719_c0_g1_i1.p1  ORF type:complete len:606 (-),score=57.22 TRINITY_DN11719_c0_g1_i1:5-1822(-)